MESLTPPSVSAIRVRHIQKKLRDYADDRTLTLRVVATGRTLSGKSTLGNSLVGVDYFLKSTGRQDCTNEVNVVKFPCRFEYVDLPGVSSDDAYENYNRVALGMGQVAEWPQAAELPLVFYKDT